jgi:hypothetical protein
MKSKKNKQVITKPVSKSLKVTPWRFPPVEYRGDKRIKDAVVITISGPAGISRSYTIHHPVGYTDLGDEAWVVSKTDEVKDLLNRIKNPGEKKLEKKRHKFLWKLIAGKLPKTVLRTEEGKIHYNLKDFPKEREEYVAEARLAEQEAHKDNPKYKSQGSSYVEYLPALLVPLESKVRAFIKKDTTRNKVEEKCPRSYRTRYAGGKAANQRKSGLFAKCNRSHDVYDKFIEVMEERSYAVKTPPASPAPPVEESKDE